MLGPLLKTLDEVNANKSWIGSSWLKLIETILYNKKTIEKKSLI